MKKQHKTPCSKCPFRRRSLPGWLGGLSVDMFAYVANMDVQMPCHSHLPNGLSYFQPTEKELSQPQCAGRAIYWSNQIKSARDPKSKLVVLPKNVEEVFEWPHEFIKHHELYKK